MSDSNKLYFTLVQRRQRKWKSEYGEWITESVVFRLQDASKQKYENKKRKKIIMNKVKTRGKKGGKKEKERKKERKSAWKKKTKVQA